MLTSIRKMGVRTNAETPEDATIARNYGAEGIGLFRTEHMFYGKGSEAPLFLLRKMILSANQTERRKALDELFVYVKKDMKATMDCNERTACNIQAYSILLFMSSYLRVQRNRKNLQKHLVLKKKMLQNVVKLYMNQTR